MSHGKDGEPGRSEAKVIGETTGGPFAPAPCRWSLVPQLLEEVRLPDVVLVHTAAPVGGVVSLGTDRRRAALELGIGGIPDAMPAAGRSWCGRRCSPTASWRSTGPGHSDTTGRTAGRAPRERR
ncbi:hypothetical protein GCM10027258_39860 [Amycolatopsis stemonae]